MKPNIFEYDNYRAFLTDLTAHLREKSREFSLRTFARDAGFGSHNYLKMVMRGERNIGKKSIGKFSKGFGLNGQEAEFFEHLVQFNQARDAEVKKSHFEKMMKTRRYREVKRVERDQYKYFSRWYNTAIREMVDMPDFQEDPEWIAKQLRPQISPRQAHQSLNLLLKLKLIERGPDRKLRQVDQTISTGKEVASFTMKNYHREMMETAIKAMDIIPNDERDFAATTLGVPAPLLPKLKDMIWEFRKRMLSTIGNAELPSDSVYQINIQVFPLSGGKQE